jgi:hypothetical protein
MLSPYVYVRLVLVTGTFPIWVPCADSLGYL